MDPLPMGPAPWDQINRAMINLFLFVGLTIDAALALLLGHAIIPSLGL